jgi:F-type H+-transporting ATPase subunit c
MKKFLFALGTVLLALPALAQETPAAAAAGSLQGIGIGIGIMMGLAVLGGALGQGKAASMALEGIARNPAAAGKLTVPLILALALMESLVLFAFLISLFLQGSVSSALSIIK